MLNTAYLFKFSRRQVICLVIVLSLVLVLFILLDITPYFAILEQYSAMIEIVIIVFDFCFNALLLYLLLVRLYKMIMSLDEPNQSLMKNSMDFIPNDDTNDSDNDCHDNKNIEMSVMDSKMDRNKAQKNQIINLMAKISLLTIIAEIFWHTFFAFVLYTKSASIPHTEGLQMYIVHRCLSCFAIICNSFVLFIAFPFNEDQYSKLCGCCHKWFKLCCIKCILRKTLYHRQSVNSDVL